MSDTFKVTLNPESLQVEPGQEIQASIEVKNEGHILDVYSIGIAGLDAEWYQLSDSDFSVFPGEVFASTITITAPEGNESVAATYDFVARVTSETFPAEEAWATGAVTVGPLYTFFHELHPEKVTATEGFFVATINNTGNAELDFNLQGEDPEGFCSFSFNPNPAKVAPQEVLDVGVTVVPSKRKLIGRPKTYNLTLTITPEQTPEVVTLPAQLEAPSKLRGWYILGAILVLLLILVGAYSAYWAAFERENLTYFRSETWPIKEDPFKAIHGVLYPYVFELEPVEGFQATEPIPVKIRGEISWKDTGDVPPSLVVILRSPDGDCWGPRQLGRTSGPFQFPIFNGGIPCNEIDYETFLLDLGRHQAAAAKYAPLDLVVNDVIRFNEHFHIAPIVRYCVNQSGSVIFDGRRPKVQRAGGPAPRGDVRYWTVYIANPHPDTHYEKFPDVTLRLKASVAEKGLRDQNKDYVLKTIRIPTRAEQWLPLPATSKDACSVEWDDQVEIATADGGIVHGTIYVQRLEFCNRAEFSCRQAGQQTGSGYPEGDQQLHAETGEDTVCGQNSVDEPGGENQASQLPAWICGELVWDKGQGPTVTSVFVILRDTAGNCWTSVEGQMIEGQDEHSAFVFDTATGQPCSDILKESTLWYLVNWFPADSERPRAAGYDANVEPLVRLCRSENWPRSPDLLFDQSNAIPLRDETSYPLETDGWDLFVINGNLSSDDVKAPKVTLKIKGDNKWRVTLKELSRPNNARQSLVVEC